jgi:hypothetical protein
VPSVESNLSGFLGRVRESDPGNTSRRTTHAYRQTMRSRPTPALPTYLREQDTCNGVIRDQVLQEAAYDVTTVGARRVRHT